MASLLQASITDSLRQTSARSIRAAAKLHWTHPSSKSPAAAGASTTAPKENASSSNKSNDRYRIGPGEVENCLVKHPAVVNAAVVPKPDRERGAVVKAFVVLAPGFTASEALVAELQQHVKGKLAPYEYPKEIEFIEALPMTTTGKVQRRVLRLQEEALARAA